MSSGTALATANKSSTDILQDCLTSIHESSRIATEISSLDSKLASLTAIKQTLITGDNISTSNLDQLNKTITEVQANADAKRKELAESEQLVITGFLDAMSQTSNQAESKTELIVDSVKESLFKFSSTVRGEVDEKLNDMDKRVTSLENNKMNLSDKDSLVQQIEGIENNLTKKQQEGMAQLFSKNIEFMKKMTAKIGTALEDIDTTRLTSNISENIMSTVDTRLKEQMEVVKKHNTDTRASITELPKAIDAFVKKELGEQITPANIQKIIQSLPEYEMMKKAGHQITTSTSVDGQNLPDFEALKKSILSLSSQLTELKQSNDATKSLVDAMRTQHLPNQSETNNTVDQVAAVKRMEEMEREVKFIHSNIKMIETVVKMKSKEMEDQQVGQKRPRHEPTTTTTTTSTEVALPNSNEYVGRLTEVENKHQKLLDYIVQCKDSVLDENFPIRLEAAMSKIEQVLLNHEKFIAFLVDPFTTTKNFQQASISKEVVPEGTLNPAMIDAISQLIKRTAEEISLPLQKKIKLLEDKLEARHSSS